MIGLLGAFRRLISSFNLIAHSRNNGGVWGGDLYPWLVQGRIIVNEVTFLKGYVPLAAGWTEALVILIEKEKAKKRTAGKMQRAGDIMAGEKEEVGETAWGPKGRDKRKLESREGLGSWEW